MAETEAVTQKMSRSNDKYDDPNHLLISHNGSPIHSSPSSLSLGVQKIKASAVLAKNGVHYYQIGLYGRVLYLLGIALELRRCDLDKPSVYVTAFILGNLLCSWGGS
jgi:hypothetical protein